MSDELDYSWRSSIADDEMVELVVSHHGQTGSWLVGPDPTARPRLGDSAHE